MTTFWNLWIFLLTAICLGLVFWVLMANRKVAVSDDEEPENRTTGHVYDGIEEYDNPLPRWWFLMFLISLIYGIIYLIWYPGVWSGLGGWTSVKELQKNQEAAQEQYAKSYDVFNQMPIEELIHDNRAIKMGVRLFANNCAVCHGADGGGNFGIPNLTDNDWLHGGSPEKILESIRKGRVGQMPPLAHLGEEKIGNIAEYVMQLSGQEHNAQSALVGKALFEGEGTCFACHGADGRGMHDKGSANLTDSIWLYGSTKDGVMHTIRNGLDNHMPAQEELIHERKIRLLAAYVYSLSFNYE